jgi:hypothetical protein
VYATVEQEVAALHRRALRPHDSLPLGNSTAPVSADLRLEIYTPSTFAEGSTEMDEDVEATESEIEEAADMSFDLDDESDSENYEDEEGAEAHVDLNTMPAAEHESIMDVTFESPERADTPAPRAAPYVAPHPNMLPMTITLCSDPPPLPRLSSVRIDDVLWKFQLTQMQGLGTPVRNHVCHRGPLTRECLSAQAQLERRLWRF